MDSVEKSPNDRRHIFGSVFLIVNALIWYFSAAKILEKVINNVTSDSQIIFVWSAHFGAIIFSLIIGAILTKKIGSKILLSTWTIIGVVSPLTLLLVNSGHVPATLLVAILFGVSLGLGMPTCMENFTQLTDSRRRGRYGGIIMLSSGLGVVLLSLLDVGVIQISALILVIWRLLGLTVLSAQKIPKQRIVQKDASYLSIMRQRPFILYLIPWLMFSLVTYLSFPIQVSVLGEAISGLMVLESAIIAIFAVIGGLLLDKYGRKRIAMVGFVLIGTGYAFLGLLPREITSWLFYTIVDGIAWGIFYVIFVITIWGDLSINGRSAKYYAIGIIPFFVSKYLQLVIGNYVSVNISEYALFSFIAFFLFLAVLPLVYAPETLPDKVMKDRELRKYIENAKKRAQRES